MDERERRHPSSDGEFLNAELRRELETQIATLQAELAETNRGVVALYAELDDKAEQLKQASELKSRFLSYVSHEFRTPLGAIRSIAQILLDRLDGPLTEEQETQVRFMQGSAAELTEMVDDLLDLAKLEAGRITIAPAWFEMVDLFSALRGMFKPILTNADVALVFEEPVALPRLYTDDKKLSQILRNLISNALKFTLRGEVRVRAVQNSDDSVVFSVADTGIGIPEDALPHLFQDFMQVDTHKHVRGTGLGLSLSRRFAELLGGHISVESTVGQGSTFYVQILIHLPGYGDA
jgi:signal transduction histidine kinase